VERLYTVGARMQHTLMTVIRAVLDGDTRTVSRLVAADPALAIAQASGGATRQNAAAFYFDEIRHYLYPGDTALHMAAAAFRRPIAELLVRRGADCRARNRRGAEPLHYAADANHWQPVAQRNDRIRALLETHL